MRYYITRRWENRHSVEYYLYEIQVGGHLKYIDILSPKDVKEIAKKGEYLGKKVVTDCDEFLQYFSHICNS